MSTGLCRYPDVRRKPWLSLTSRIPDTGIGATSGAVGARDGAARCWVMVDMGISFRGQRKFRYAGRRTVAAQEELTCVPGTFGEKQSPEGLAFLGDALRPYPDLGRGSGAARQPLRRVPTRYRGKLTYRDCIP